ncbi:lysophospholipid acyltransferase family protein [Hyphomicrobiales bacterium]|jgi:putative hemolysin|nr:glycerol acyltransferase [Alphaproteobacteria bacterium]MDC0474354.1 lysophospholipid acyltransferase family protein [Hyphomicrobiales bacterium]MDG1152759.1 lysophospholipid acyltransferase family protein [Hyphomicrobiales bacterium]MDG1524066.1 lysophospholipid acyltransferase family protein [Hyphomicrobiales bacterium]|tara:strand:+ start:856 stop:1722 length:867 start_codon:yes stop_codon:yes gene_type:complete
MEYLDTKYFSYANPDDPIHRKALIRSIEYVSGQPYLYGIYKEYQKNPNRWESFWDGCVDLLELNVKFDEEKIKNVPNDGPLMIVANHPFGVLDGLIICWLTSKIRSEFKVLTHSLLLRAQETKDYLLPIDFSESKDAMKTNLETRKTARNILDDGGTIVVFPGGTVSTTKKFYNKTAFDPEWRNFTSRLIKRSKPTILPLHFTGQNSYLFQTASHLSETLRSSLLFHEVKRRINTEVPVIIGDPIDYSHIDENLSNTELSKYLRDITYQINPKWSSKEIPLGKDFKEF